MANRVFPANSLNLDGIPLTSTGVRPIQSPKLILNNRPPTPSDANKSYPIGCIWVVLNRSAASADQYEFWYLADNQSIPGALWLRFAVSPSGKFVSQFTTLDDGNVAIPSTALGNINLQGLGGLQVLTPVNLGDTITFSLTGTIAESFPTDSGTAVPSGNVLNIFGSVGGAGHTGDNINTSGSGNTVVVHLNKSLHMPVSNSSGSEGVWYTRASGSPLVNGNLFISNIGIANTFVGELSGNLTLNTGSSEQNSGFGAGALAALTTGSENCCFGYVSGASFTTMSGAVAIGSEALASATVGAPSGNNSVAIGYHSMTNATTVGADNGGSVAIGYESMLHAVSVTGNNVAVGQQTLQTASGNGTSESFYNTAIGGFSLQKATTAFENTAVGAESGENLLTGGRNVLLGWNAGGSYAGAESDNVCIGSPGVVGESSTFRVGNRHNAGTGVTDVYIGDNAGFQVNAATNYNIAIGYQAGFSIVDSQTSVFIGQNAGHLITTGNSGVAIGKDAAAHATTGNGSGIAIGSGALNASVGLGSGCVAIGAASLRLLVGDLSTNTCDDNTAVGFDTGSFLQVGKRNTFIGSRSGALENAGGGPSTMNGSYNTCLGAWSYGNNAGGLTVTGSYNILIGSAAGIGFASSESSNIMLTSEPGGGTWTGFSNTVVIGNGTGTGNGQQNKCFISGIRGITTANNDAVAVLVDSADQLGTVSSSLRFKENVQDMGDASSCINEMRPVTFNYKSKDVSQRSPGLIAEEVETIAPWLVSYGKDGLPETVRYHELPVLLLNELQKLSKRVAQLEDKLDNCCC